MKNFILLMGLFWVSLNVFGQPNLPSVSSQLSVTPTNLNFSSTNTTQTITVSNVGAGTLDGISTSLSGDTANFSVRNNCRNASLTTQTCNVTITFVVPNDNTPRTANLSITSNNGGNASVSLTGTGTASSNTGGNTPGALANIPTIAVGYNHFSLVIDSKGDVWSWGNNPWGELGDGTRTGHIIPSKVEGISNVYTIDASQDVSLAVDTNQTLWTWGSGYSLTPDQFKSNIVAVAAGSRGHYLALDSTGKLWAWGWNNYGKLGDGTTERREEPVFVKSNIKAIAAGSAHSLAIDNDGHVWAWGWNNSGQLGNDTFTGAEPNPDPLKVDGISNVVAISAGAAHSLALDSNGQLWGWGSNYSGQLGIGSQQEALTPTLVKSNITKISAGSEFSLALDNNGVLWAWGMKLGIGLTLDKLTTPIRVMSEVVDIDAGRLHALARKRDNTLWAWGANSAGELGDGTTIARDEPVLVQFDFVTPNKAPIANFTMTPSSGDAPLTVTLNASSSTDDGTITNYAWTSSTGQTASGRNTSLTFNTVGTHNITLTVTDDQGATANLSKTVTVQAPNQAPVANFTVTPSSGEAPLTVNLDASRSTDDGTITSYVWTTSTGQTTSGKNSSLTFNTAGTHTITLTVKDDKLATASINQAITVEENQSSETIRLVVVDYPTHIKPGDDFDLTLQFVPDKAKPADGIEIYLEFDPSKLQVNSITNSGVLDFELENKIGENYLNFAATSFFNEVPTEAFDLVTINFTALESTGGIDTILHFNTDQTNFTHQGEYISQSFEDIHITIEEARVACKVDLQGRPQPPDASWETDLKIYSEGKVYSIQTDDSGLCGLPNELPLGDYSICVKGSHTLANRIGPPLAVGSDNMIDFGTLLEGDVNDDNKIDLLDSSELRKLINHAKPPVSQDDPNYNQQADMNADGIVDDTDIGFLKENFKKPTATDDGICEPNGKKGETNYRRGFRETRKGGTVTLRTAPIPRNLTVGTTFEVVIQVQSTVTQAIDAAAAYLNFDPKLLQVNGLTAGSRLDYVLQEEFDNVQGQINFAASLWKNSLLSTGTFTLVTVHFTLLAEGGEKTLAFNLDEPRKTTAAFDGTSKVAPNQPGGEVVFYGDRPNIAPASCQLYAVHDQALNDSQLFTVNPNDYQVNKLGPLHKGYDIEAIAVHPQTNIIYVVSGKDVDKDKPRGHLYIVDGQTGELFPIGSTTFKEIEDLAFGNDGTLWAWAKGDGMITIDLATGEGTLQIDYDAKVEGLTLNKDNIFYGAIGNELWVYDQATNQLQVACDNLPGETEALEMLPDGLLLMGIHQDKSSSLHAFDVNSCQLVPNVNVPTHPFDDVEGITLPTKACAK
jgi:alpha-tubulin suppressor-like RCC1 family protein/chitodextrinase